MLFCSQVDQKQLDLEKELKKDSFVLVLTISYVSYIRLDELP